MINPLQRPALSVCAALGVMVLLTLGTWQVQRLAWKESLIETVNTRRNAMPVPLWQTMAVPVDVEAVEYTPVRLDGRWKDGSLLFVVGTFEGAPGYYGFSQFHLSRPLNGRSRILVNRGFVPSDAVPDDYRIPVDEGPVTLSGLVRAFDPETGLAARMAPPPDEGRPIFYRRSYNAFSQFVDEPLSPFYIDSLEGASPGSVPLGGTTRVTFSNNHLGYAITWYGLAAGLLVVYWVAMRLSQSIGRGDHSDQH